MESLTKYLSWAAGFFILMILTYILGDIFIQGISHMEVSYLFDSPLSAGRRGGIYPIIVSTLLILLVCLSVVIPTGLMTAFYLTEYMPSDTFASRTIKRSIEILASVPSIVFGLFGNALFCVYLKMGFSIISGGLTLALMALPLFISSVENGIRGLPETHRKIAHSLGFRQHKIILNILLPAVIPSITVGLVLSIGRALAETAALIFTSGYVDRAPGSLFDSGRALSVHIYDLSMNVPGGDTNAYKSSLILVLLIVFTNTIVSVLLQLWYQRRILL